jgi:DNA polymerase-3 subunit gamma/tau
VCKGVIFIYKALYRKWRPLTFDDVVSQPHITTTLSNQIISGKTAHAYLFTGSRGTGKTTCARIFAKTINCLNVHDGKPCLECEICKGADEGTLSDIIEIDAASNNGVDDIRDIREAALFTPEKCKYKVYIIDEVHMLSTNAFNALLKIMEEPPSYIKFILATTEVHKVPATILSRCQRYDFRRILTEDIVDRLLYIASEENIQLENDAAQLIARIADGGMRDALSLLDQCIAFSDNVNIETVSSAAGIAGRDYLFELLDAIINHNASQALSIIDKLYSMSKDMQRLCEELLSQMRNLMLVKTVPEQKNLLACLPDEIEKLTTLSKAVGLDDILNKLNVLQECNERLTRSLSKRIELEMCMIKLCTQTTNRVQEAVSQDSSELLERIHVLEKALQSGAVVNEKNQTVRKPSPVVNSTPTQPQEPSVDLSKITSDMLKPLDCWPEILEDFNKINPAVSGSLKGSQAFVYENLMLLIVQNEFFLKLFKNKDNANSLGDVIKAHLGKSFIIRAKCSSATKKDESNPVDKLISKAHDANIQVEIKD